MTQLDFLAITHMHWSKKCTK